MTRNGLMQAIRDHEIQVSPTWSIKFILEWNDPGLASINKCHIVKVIVFIN